MATLQEFAEFSDFRGSIDLLAEVAMKESWGPENTILKFYVNAMFARAAKTGLIATTDTIAIFNVGLCSEPIDVDPVAHELFALFTKNRDETPRRPWHFQKWQYERNAIRLFGNKLPKRPSFCEKPCDMCYDNTNFLDLSPDHIPTGLYNVLYGIEKDQHDADTVKIDLALKNVQHIAHNNQRYAVPMFYTRRDQIQFLLPLMYEGARSLLVVARSRPPTDDGTTTGSYVLVSVVSVLEGYKAARLLGSIESSWLQALLPTA